MIKIQKVNGSYPEKLYRVSYKTIPISRNEKEEYHEDFVLSSGMELILTNIFKVINDGLYKVEHIKVEIVDASIVRIVEDE